MRGTIIALLLVAGATLAGCRVTEEVTHRGEVLTYRQYQSIRVEDQLTAETIIQRYGQPNDVLERDGKTTKIIYRCENRVGKYRNLELEFDENEVLRRTELDQSR